MIWILGFLSIAFTLAMMAVGTILILTKKKPLAPGEDDKMRDENKSLWAWFGYVSNTPNTYRAIVQGNENDGPIIEYISPGMIRDRATRRMRPMTNDEMQKYASDIICRKFGKIRFGDPVLNNLRPLRIDRVVKLETAKAGSTLAEQLTAKSVTRYGLKETIFRPTYQKDLDTTDGTRFNVTSYATLRIFDPAPAYEIYPDNFLETISEVIAGLISKKKVLPYDWEHYKAIGKDVTTDDLAELNTKLEPMGVEILSLTMSDPEINADMQEALERAKKADEDRKAKKKAGEAERDYQIDVAKGAAKAMERLAKAKRARMTELIEEGIARGLSSVAAYYEAQTQVRAEFTFENLSKLTGTLIIDWEKLGINVNPRSGGGTL